MVVIGADTVGKTSLLIRYTTDYFSPDGYLPSVYDNYVENVYEPEVNGPILLELFDTAGDDEHARERLMLYPSTNVFLLCYSIEDKTSFNLAREKFISEATTIAPDARVVLVACKTDLRSSDQELISTGDGKKLANEINAIDFIECSSLTGNNVRDVFRKPLRLIHA